MPLSVDRFLITVTRSGKPTSSGRDSISEATADVVTQVRMIRACDGQEQLEGGGGGGEGENRHQKCDKRRRKEVKMETIQSNLWK